MNINVVWYIIIKYIDDIIDNKLNVAPMTCWKIAWEYPILLVNINIIIINNKMYYVDPDPIFNLYQTYIYSNGYEIYILLNPTNLIHRIEHMADWT